MQQSLIKVIKNSTGRGVSHLRIVLEIEGIFQGGITLSVFSNENAKKDLNESNYEKNY